jgi:hypothetical protein
VDRSLQPVPDADLHASPDAPISGAEAAMALTHLPREQAINEISLLDWHGCAGGCMTLAGNTAPE